MSPNPSARSLDVAKIGFSVVVYCLSVAAVPIYNKKVFEGFHGLKKFPYPITTAFLQLGCVAFACGALNVAQHFLTPAGRHDGRSWIFGAHFGYKLQHVAPVGLLFGLKYAITNWGLLLVNTDTHLLLQATDLAWTCLFSRVINKERPGFMGYLAALTVTAGSCCIALHATTELHVDALGLGVNLITPFVLALCITTLRTGAVELARRDNCVGGTVSPLEFTCIKLVLSSLVCLVLSCILESGVLNVGKDKRAWWVELSEMSAMGFAVTIVGGGVFVLIFQVNITWLTQMTTALTVGIVGGLKVVPQWMLNALFNLKVDLHGLNILGAALVLLGSVMYAYSRVARARAGTAADGAETEPFGCSELQRSS